MSLLCAHHFKAQTLTWQALCHLGQIHAGDLSNARIASCGLSIRHQHNGLAIVGNLNRSKAGGGGQQFFWRFALQGLAFLAWCLLCVAAARPQQLGPAIAPPQVGRDLMLAVDLSASMGEEDMELGGRIIDRLAAAKAVLADFLDRRVGDVELGLHAHLSYLERHGQPASVADLAHHVLIGFDRETPFLRSAATRLPIWQRDNFHWRCDSDLAQLALLRAGAGIGGCQTALARRDPNLVRVLPTRLSMKLTTWVAMHEGLRNSPRCKAAFSGNCAPRLCCKSLSAGAAMPQAKSAPCTKPEQSIPAAELPPHR